MTVEPVSWIGEPIWTGSEFLLLTSMHPGIIQRVGADGTLGPSFPLGVDVPDTSWPIAWTGSELGVVSSVTGSAGGTLQLARYGADGTQLGTSTVAEHMLSRPDYQTLRWAGDRYVLAWSAGNTAAIREVSADGVPGTTSTVTDVGDSVYALAATSQTCMAIFVNHLGGPFPTFVTIDRATGALSQHVITIGLGSTSLLVHDRDFVVYDGSVIEPDNTTGSALQTIDASGMETTSIAAPVLVVPTMVVTSSGYHLVSASPDTTGDWMIKDADVAFGGTQGPVNVRAIVPNNGSFAGAHVTSRGNGLLTVWASGPNNALTARLIQECTP